MTDRQILDLFASVKPLFLVLRNYRLLDKQFHCVISRRRITNKPSSFYPVKLFIRKSIAEEQVSLSLEYINRTKPKEV